MSDMFGMKPSTATSTDNAKLVKVGIIGCGMQTQVIHIPTLNLMSHLFQITYLYDVSKDATKHCQSRVAGVERPRTTQNVEELTSSSDVDLVMVVSNHVFHASHTETALKAGKFVFVEKPIALTLQDTDCIIAADEAAGGSKVFVGYMRRYAAAFLDAVKEIGSIDQIRYARVRDIIGPNHVFVGQSGTFPRTFDDYRPEDTQALRDKTASDMRQALGDELSIEVTKDRETTWEMLSTLGSHDLSAMREILGMPLAVVGFSPCAASGAPFWSAIFQYPGFVVGYESGLDQVARFDASIEIFGDKKTVKLCIDTPFVKGLPTTMEIKETLADGSYRQSTVRKTYEDAFTLEFLAVHEWMTMDKTPKTSAKDAREDLEILGMLMKAAYKS